jgi:hypothetical protein
MKFKNQEWRRLNIVWEHTSGVRLAPAGMIRFPNPNAYYGSDYKFINTNLIEHQSRLSTLTIMYGNRRRGLMAFAIELWNKENSIERTAYTEEVTCL